jgi:DNA polymerase-3 subunit epsilon
MTRGQNTLVIDMLETGEGALAEAVAVDLSALQLPVLLATEAEMEAHAGVLKDIDKASGGKTVWAREMQDAAPAA